ncbi:MAG TPA: DUF3379 family protein [Opitutaceae bacterium]
MDNEEAKFILRAYRPSGVDAADPKFAEALAQAKRDPSLSKWLDHEQALDRAIAAKLNRVTVPADLRESILTGAKVSALPPWWRRGYFKLAMAACFLVALGGAFSYSLSRRRAMITQVAQVAIEDVLHGQHNNRGEAVARLENVLENASFHLSNGSMPANLTALESNGCRVVQIGGKNVAEICFERSGQYFHLYVMARMGGMSAKPLLFEYDGGRAAAWTDEHNSYVVATTASAEQLRNIL